MTTLSYMQGLMPENGSDLDLRYQKVLLSFEELNKLPPNALLFGIGELTKKVFLGIRAQQVNAQIDQQDLRDPELAEGISNPLSNNSHLLQTCGLRTVGNPSDKCSFQSSVPLPKGVAEIALYCAHRTRTF